MPQGRRESAWAGEIEITCIILPVEKLKTVWFHFHQLKACDKWSLTRLYDASWWWEKKLHFFNLQSLNQSAQFTLDGKYSESLFAFFTMRNKVSSNDANSTHCRDMMQLTVSSIPKLADGLCEKNPRLAQQPESVCVEFVRGRHDESATRQHRETRRSSSRAARASERILNRFFFLLPTNVRHLFLFRCCADFSLNWFLKRASWIFFSRCRSGRKIKS